MPDGSLTPAKTDAAGHLVASLALMYLRHDDAPRALALGLAAMRSGPVSPRLALLVAQAFLRTGDAEQAVAILSRFDQPGRLSAEATAPERRSNQILRAKAAYRQGRSDEARALLAQATQGLGGEQ